MGSVLTHKAVGGGLPGLGPWHMEVREPVRYESGYAFFDVSDLSGAAEEIFFMAVVSGTQDYVYGGSYVSFNPGKVNASSVLPNSWYAITAKRDTGKTGVSITVKDTPMASTANGELKVHMRPDTTSGGTYTAQGGFLLVMWM